jgi:hypothetical protein
VNKIKFTLSIIAMFVLAITCSSMAQAQATRTWVSGVGDDANPCSRTAPCKTFAGAISKTAAAGEIDALDPGGFGTLTITKSITIDGQGTLASVLSAGTNGFNVNVANTDTVILRNLTINGVGTGINGINWFNAGGNLIVDNVDIERVTGSGIFANLTNSGNLTVTRSRIRNCGSTDNVDAAIRVTTTFGTVRATINDVNMTNNRVGVNVGERSVVFVRDSVAAGNELVGLPVGYNITSSSASFMFLENCTATHNNSGVRTVGNSGGINQTVTMSNCNIYDNSNAGVNIGPNSAGTTYTNNRITGNGTDVSGSFTGVVGGLR